jgi:hypothetical protein
MLLKMLSYVSALASAGRLISTRTVSAISFFVGLLAGDASGELNGFALSAFVTFCFGALAADLDAPLAFCVGTTTGSCPASVRKV